MAALLSSSGVAGQGNHRYHLYHRLPTTAQSFLALVRVTLFSIVINISRCCLEILVNQQID